MRKQNSCGDANELVTNFFTTDIDYMEDFHKKKKKQSKEKKKIILVPLLFFALFGSSAIKIVSSQFWPFCIATFV